MENGLNNFPEIKGKQEASLQDIFIKSARDYLKVTSPLGGDYNHGLKKAITHIGKNHGKLAGKEGYDEIEYFKSGMNIIVKYCGRFSGTAVKSMIYPNIIAKGTNNRQWCYHKRIYGMAYEYIIRLLRICSFDDNNYAIELLRSLYLEIEAKFGKDDNLTHVCSDAILYRQKGMLDTYKRKNIWDSYYAAKILNRIKKVDDEWEIKF